MLNAIIQFCIFLFGVTSIVLVSRKNKWGFVVGLCSQPFWLLNSFINKEWGIFLVSIAYTVSWSYGIYEWFFKKNEKNNNYL